MAALPHAKKGHAHLQGKHEVSAVCKFNRQGLADDDIDLREMQTLKDWLDEFACRVTNPLLERLAPQSLVKRREKGLFPCTLENGVGDRSANVTFAPIH
jgi:hypothetical protein